MLEKAGFAALFAATAGLAAQSSPSNRRIVA
jgi:hypothetical protein